MQAFRTNLLERGGPLFLLLGCTTVRTASASHLRSAPSHHHRRYLALYTSPPQPHSGRGTLLTIWCRSGPGNLGQCQKRGIAATAVVSGKAIKKTNYPPRPKVTEDEIEEKFLKGSGPGGQKINKTNSAVQLHHIPTGIVVKSQETRSREQNRKIARRILAEKLEELEKGPESRSVVLRREESRKKRSKDKKARRKYAKLAMERNNAGLAAGDEVAGGVRESLLTEGEGGIIEVGSINKKKNNLNVVENEGEDDEFSEVKNFSVDEDELDEDEDEDEGGDEDGDEDEYSDIMDLPEGLDDLDDDDFPLDDTSDSDNDEPESRLSARGNSGESVAPASAEQIHPTKELSREVELERKRDGSKQV